MSLWNYKLKQWIPLYSYSKDLKQEQWQHQILVRMQSLFHSWRKANWDSHFGRQFGNFFSFFKLFLERGEGREKERERNVNAWLPIASLLLETWPATQACALTGNQTGNPLVLRPAFNLQSHPARAVSLQNETHSYTDSSVTFLDTYLNELKICPHKHLNIDVWSSFIHNCPNGSNQDTLQ